MHLMFRWKVRYYQLRPFFDYKLGTYTCKGFHDDTEMVECDKVYQINEITRDPWVL